MLKGRKLFKTCKQIHILFFKLILILASGRNKLFDVVCYDKRSLSGKKYNIYIHAYLQNIRICLWMAISIHRLKAGAILFVLGNLQVILKTDPNLSSVRVKSDCVQCPVSEMKSQQSFFCEISNDMYSKSCRNWHLTSTSKCPFWLTFDFFDIVKF